MYFPPFFHPLSIIFFSTQHVIWSYFFPPGPGGGVKQKIYTPESFTRYIEKKCPLRTGDGRKCSNLILRVLFVVGNIFINKAPLKIEGGYPFVKRTFHVDKHAKYTYS